MNKVEWKIVITGLNNNAMSNIELTEEDSNKEEVINNLLESDWDTLKDIHAKNYTGTDDEMSDRFEDWIYDLSSEEIIELLKHENPI